MTTCPMCRRKIPVEGCAEHVATCGLDSETAQQIKDWADRAGVTDEHAAREIGPGASSYYAWSKDGQLYGGLLEDYARSEEVAAHHGQTIGRPYRVVALADDTVILEEN